MRTPCLKALAGLFLASCLVTPVMAETLSDALRQAYDESPRLESERARLRATDELVPQALSGWRPLVRATSGYTIDRQQDEGPYVPRSDAEGNSNADVLYQFDAGLTAQQSLYAGGETVAQTRRAENQVRSQRARLDDVEQAVLLDVVEAYAAVVRARQVLVYSEQNLDRLIRYLEGVQDRFRLAELTTTDVAQARSRVAGAEADLARARNELETATADFERAVGQPPGELAPVKPLAGLPGTVDEALAMAARNPRVVQAGFDLEAARAQVRVDEAQLLPDLNLVGELSHRTQPQIGLHSRQNASIGAQLVVPIYQRGAEYSRVRQSKQTAIQRRYDLSDAERNIRREVLASFDAVRTAREQIASLDEQVRAALEARDGTREEAIAGARTVLDLLDAELELFLAQIRRERAVEQEVVATYRLKAAVGELRLADLGFGEPHYDPEQYYNQVRDRWFGLAVADPAWTPTAAP